MKPCSIELSTVYNLGPSSVFLKISDMNWYCSTCTCGPVWKITVVNLLRKYPFTVLVCQKTVLLNVHLNCMHSLS